MLVREVRYRRLDLLQKAVYARDVHGRPEDVPQWVEAAGRLTVADVLPRIETCRGRTVVRLTDRKSAWGPEMAYYLGDRPPSAPMPDGVVDSLRETLLAVIAANGGSPDTVILTHGVKVWSRVLSGDDHATWVRCYRELTVPVPAGGDGDWGRVDAVVAFPAGTGVADVVVEIDQTNKQRSVEKLQHVRDAGGVPIWVRWGGGPIDSPDWLPVIDL